MANICKNLQKKKENELNIGKYLQKFAKKKENELNIGKYLQNFAKKKIKLIKYWQIFYGNLRIFPKLCEKEIN